MKDKTNEELKAEAIAKAWKDLVGFVPYHTGNGYQNDIGI